jgi:tetratricopeptide (TPR) repeat protein
LLVGNEYGNFLEGEKASYTHLEYRRARRDGSKTILPFLIGNPHHPDIEPKDYADSDLGAWVSEIRKNHTPSYLDRSLGDEQLASDIFDEVLARLVEIFWNVDEGDIEGDPDETSGLPEDSPIKLEQLADSPKISDDKQMLKILAANHAKEALAALNLGLPQVAIHHLRKAAELVPLDIVIGYWLARLLVATGRRKQCLEARRTALLCARIAAEGDDEQRLQAMACRIIAVRANERLGELDLALEHAEAAHEDMGHHWMAKLEYGRQLALSGKKTAALKMASQAFWLRPDLIRQIQRDSAYRGLGKAFEEFRAALKKTVIDEMEQITEVESLIREFARRLGVDEPDAFPGVGETVAFPGVGETVAYPDLDEPVAYPDLDEPVAYPDLDEPVAYPFEEPAEQPHHEQPHHEQPHHERRTVLRMIGAGRASVKSSLQFLRKCAQKLLADSVYFTFEGVKGLTPEIKEHILEEIRTVSLEVNEHSDQLKITKRKAEQSSEKISALMHWGIIGALILGIAAIMAVFFKVIIVAVVALVIITLGGWSLWKTFQSLKAEKKKNLESARETSRQLTQAEARSAELGGTLSNFETAESELQKNTITFCELVDLFEITSLSKRTFAPAVPVDRDKKGAQGLVWSDNKKAEKLGIAVELELLPLQLRLVAGSSTPESTYWLARRVRSGEIEVLNRSAAYFQ